MKKSLLIVFFMSLLLIISGCDDLLLEQGNSTENNTQDNNTQDNSTQDNSTQDNSTQEDNIINEFGLKINYEIQGQTVNFSVEYDQKHGAITSYYWEFGDGAAPKEEEKPTHTYKEYKKYIPTLDVKFADGTKGFAMTEFQIEPPALTGERQLFFKDFGTDSNKIYFAIRFQGISKESRFMQQIPNSSQGAYARDLQFGINNDSNTFLFSDEINIPLTDESSKQHNLTVNSFYGQAFGWTNAVGSKLDIPFYIGYKAFYVTKNNPSVSFGEFSIVDGTKKGPLGGYLSFYRCNSGELKINIPVDKYNPNIHKNIALITITLDDNICRQNGYGYEVKFDKFLEK